ncbi:hypothetical protein FLONG3_7403 [Fusarium longipes]|uniref:CCHC-type domain-containing protein n=1 Tax=Fusarium longipes TaxID=694270 RepID=A0A395SDN9_9HYPO|nr:hypothetical protein FLONG3_7403 [Fusarium longipes]
MYRSFLAGNNESNGSKEPPKEPAKDTNQPKTKDNSSKKANKRKDAKDHAAARDVKCWNCQKTGHIASQCPAKAQQRQSDRAEGVSLAANAVTPRLTDLERSMKTLEEGALATANKMKKERKEDAKKIAALQRELEGVKKENASFKEALGKVQKHLAHLDTFVVGKKEEGEEEEKVKVKVEE